MSRRIPLRQVVPALLAATLLSAAAVAQSQDTVSVAEAARRARQQKKTAAKPVKVVTDDDIKPRTPTSSESLAASDASAAGASNDAPAPANAGSAATPGSKDEKAAKELAELKAMIKETQSDIDLLARKQSLEQDSFFSNPDYSRDSAGKARLDALKQQVSDKQVDLEKLKAHLLDLQAALDTKTAPKP